MFLDSQPGPTAHLARFEGSFFGLRAAVEPIARLDEPELLIVYLPGVQRDRKGSVLMELEKGGTCYEPQLKQLARNVLRQRLVLALEAGTELATARAKTLRFVLGNEFRSDLTRDPPGSLGMIPAPVKESLERVRGVAATPSSTR